MLIVNFDDVIREAIEDRGSMQVKHLATNRRIFARYILTIRGFNGDIYDYYLWLRVQRERIMNSKFKVKRRKTPQWEHGFRKMSIIEFYEKYIQVKELKWVLY